MTPGLARIKRAVREAIERCGHLDGAAATALRKRSVVGDWNNLNTRAFPPLDCALAMDEVAVAQNLTPPILTRYAAELGHVAIRLPAGDACGEDQLTAALIAASAEFGDIAAEVRDATRDGDICEREKERIAIQIDEAMVKLVEMKAVVQGAKGAKRRAR